MFSVFPVFEVRRCHWLLCCPALYSSVDLAARCSRLLRCDSPCLLCSLRSSLRPLSLGLSEDASPPPRRLLFSPSRGLRLALSLLVGSGGLLACFGAPRSPLSRARPFMVVCSLCFSRWFSAGAVLFFPSHPRGATVFWCISPCPPRFSPLLPPRRSLFFFRARSASRCLCLLFSLSTLALASCYGGSFSLTFGISPRRRRCVLPLRPPTSGEPCPRSPVV